MMAIISVYVYSSVTFKRKDNSEPGKSQFEEDPWERKYCVGLVVGKADMASVSMWES